MKTLQGFLGQNLLVRLKVMPETWRGRCGAGAQRHAEVWPSLMETPGPERRWEENTPQRANAGTFGLFGVYGQVLLRWDRDCHPAQPRGISPLYLIAPRAAVAVLSLRKMAGAIHLSSGRL